MWKMIAGYQSGSPPRFPTPELGGLVSGTLTVPMYTETPLSPEKKGGEEGKGAGEEKGRRGTDVKEGSGPRSGRVEIYDQA